MKHRITIIGGSAAPVPPATEQEPAKAPAPSASPKVIGGGVPSLTSAPEQAQPGQRFAPSVFKPTTMLGQPGRSASAPAPAAPPEPVKTAQPTSFAPKAISVDDARAPAPAAIPAAMLRPVAMPGTVRQASDAVAESPKPEKAWQSSEPAAVSAEPFRPAALPGTQRRPVEVSMEDLEREFPRYSHEERNGAQGFLAGFSLAAANPTVILAFGKGPQEVLTAIAKERLTIAQRPGVRYVVQHLARLQALLQEVLDSFEGGFLRKSPEKVWRMHCGEIQQIEQLLDAADDKLAAELGELATIKKRCEDCKKELGGIALAAEFLVGRLREDVSGLMLSRLGSITASQAMVIEQITMIDRDAEQLQELTLLVQDGVVLRLPAIYAQLTALGGRINDTDRFHAVERLTQILTPLKERKLP